MVRSKSHVTNRVPAVLVGSMVGVTWAEGATVRVNARDPEPLEVAVGAGERVGAAV